MNRELLVRAAGLYAPITIALWLVLWRGPALVTRHSITRMTAALLLACGWNAVALLALNSTAIQLGWWSFHADAGLIAGIPVDLYLGWVVFWAIVPTFLFGSLPIAVSASVMAILDVVLMPLCEPVVRLGPTWYVGEVVAIAAAYIPSQYLARRTIDNRQLESRAVLQVILFAGLIVYVIPTIVLQQTGGTWAALLERPWIWNSMLFQVLAIPAILGLSAVQEFVARGRGTPLPYDPPTRLVTTGPYAFVANPMQLSAAIVFAIWGAMLESVWIVAAAVMTVIYSQGLATWHERDHLVERFGGPWTAYRGEVRPWRMRVRPFVDCPATLYVAETCSTCRGVGRWLLDRQPVGLRIIAAEEHPSRTLVRMTYEPASGGSPNEGIAAFARALEHTHLGWAWVGMFIRLPIVRSLLQLLVDASGGYARPVARRSIAPRVP